MAAIFGSAGHIGWAQECARAVLVFLYGLAIIRIAGRRLFGKWAALDIVVSVVIGSNLSRALTGGAPLGGTLAATSLLVAMHWALARGAAMSPGISRLLEGAAVTLAAAGTVDRGGLRRHCVSATDLGEALRQAGLRELSEADRITLEPSGKITVLKPAPGDKPGPMGDDKPPR